MSFGVVATGHALGERVEVAEVAGQYTDDVRRVREWGYRAFHRAAPEVGLTDLAAEAGRQALERAGLAAGDVDLLVLAIPDIAEYLYWDAAAATQAKIGAHQAEAVLVNQACGAGVAAFDTVAGKLATHPDYRVALLVAANRVCEPYWNRMESNTSIASDGAAALVVTRDHPGRRWLATEIITDGRYADFVRLGSGGAARPFVAGQPAPGTVRNPFLKLENFFDHDVRAMAQFVRQIRGRSREVLERACKSASVSTGDIRYLIHLNDNIKAVTELARTLDLPLDQTNAQLAMEHGHLGSADQILSLGQLIDAGALSPGDLVALTSIGSGMHWVCTLLRI